MKRSTQWYAILLGCEVAAAALIITDHLIEGLFVGLGSLALALAIGRRS